MKRLFQRSLGVALFALLAGSGLGCGVGSTRAENNRTISRVVDYDARMMVDDLGLASQLNRPWRGSRYPIR